MNKRHFVSFIISAVFGLVMVLYAAAHVPVPAAYAGERIGLAAGGSNAGLCPVAKNSRQAHCPVLENSNCPARSGCPVMDGSATTGQCPYTLLEKKHRSAYIFILSPTPQELKQGKTSDEIRI